MAGKNGKHYPKGDRWSKVCQANGIDRVIEQSANGVFQANGNTTIRCSEGAHIVRERHGESLVFKVSNAVYTILESVTPTKTKVRHLFTEAEPKDLEERRYL